MYVLDTNTIIYFFKNQGRVGTRIFVEKSTEIAIPAIVIFEIQTGIAKSTSPQKRTRQLKSLMDTVSILPFSIEAAQAAATIRAQLEKKGKPIGPYDVLIAGTALAHQATLVTRNLGEFNRVKGLKTEDWY